VRASALTADARRPILNERSGLVSDNYRHDNFNRKKLCRLRSEVYGKLHLASA
jgi:hypothetical protein